MNIRHINTTLLVAIGLINGYIIFTPLLPRLTYALQKPDGHIVAQLEQKITKHSAPTAKDISAPNALIIPKLGFDEPIHTGKHANTLSRGLWLRPQGSTPDQGSNTVIVGHRFTYTNPRGVFYHLDKLRPGDTIGVSWNGAMHHYKVRETKIVPATKTSVESDTPASQLTLYTCTPLWLPKDRLVVIAEEVPSE